MREELSNVKQAEAAAHAEMQITECTEEQVTADFLELLQQLAKWSGLLVTVALATMPTVELRTTGAAAAAAMGDANATTGTA